MLLRTCIDESNSVLTLVVTISTSLRCEVRRRRRVRGRRGGEAVVVVKRLVKSIPYER